MAFSSTAFSVLDSVVSKTVREKNTCPDWFGGTNEGRRIPLTGQSCRSSHIAGWMAPLAIRLLFKSNSGMMGLPEFQRPKMVDVHEIFINWLILEGLDAIVKTTMNIKTESR